jgi:hypothetical protein
VEGEEEVSKIRGYNCPVKQLTVPAVNGLCIIGLKSYRCVEPYGFASDDHIREILTTVITNRGEAIVTLFNSNSDVWRVVSAEVREAILAKEKQDEGKATRCLIALGIRTRNKEILDWLIAEAQRIRRIVPPGTKIELWNPDIQYWGTNWTDWTKLLPEYVPLCQMLGGTPTYTGFSYLDARLHGTWFDLWTRTIKGGFLYGEKDRIDRVGLQSNLMEFGANVHDCPQKFYELLPGIRAKYRVYCQWLVDPAFDGYSNVTSEELFDVEQAKAIYQRENYKGDPYCIIPVLGWDAIRAFAAS